MGLHFLNDVHGFHYRRLAAKWEQAEDGNFQYMVACYVLAIPEVYKKVDWDRVQYPFSWRAEAVPDGKIDDFVEDRQDVDLSSGFRALVDFAEHIYSGGSYPFNLDDSLDRWDEELYSVFQECLRVRIRRGRI